MREKLMMTYLKGKLEVGNTLRRFVSEEKGASDMVAVILLIVIVIAIATVFKRELGLIVDRLLLNLSEFVG